MDHLVVRDRHTVILGEGVHQGEIQSLVQTASVYRIGRYVVVEVVCPAHIPFEIEAHAAGGYGRGHPGERRRFLRDHHHVGKFREHGGIQLPDKGGRLLILVGAVGVGDPFTGVSVVIEIDHRGYGIHPQTVYVELSQEV